MKRRLEKCGIHNIAAEVNAVLITHEHTDHISSLKLFAAAGVDIYMSEGTAYALGFCGAKIIRAGESFEVGDLHISPFAVPHDAEEPVQFVFGECLGIFTDFGYITPEVEDAARGLSAMVVECNYDERMLAENAKYPRKVKERIAGPTGHLDNYAAAELVAHANSAKLRHIVAAHLSAQNNDESLVFAALAKVCNPRKITIASQNHGCQWLQVAR